MINLIIAIIMSSLVSLVMRAGEPYIKNNMVMFTANYIVCSLFSYTFTHFGTNAGGSVHTGSVSGFRVAVIIGVISGILYLGSFVLLQYNIKRNGIILAPTFMKLGVLVPTLMAVLVYHESPTVSKMIGLVLAVAAIVVINSGKDSEEHDKSGIIWLLVLLLASGFTDSTSNIYTHMGDPALKDFYLLFTFGMAGVLAIIMAVYKKQHFTWQDVGWGVLIGVPNYFCSKFLLLALGQLEAILVYPLYNVMAILVITVCGVLIFKEQLTKTKICGLAMILLAIVMLNL